MYYTSSLLKIPSLVLDTDAQAFLNAAAITNETITKAINDLVVGLKSNSLWPKMKALYPFVGGTEFTHKFNLKDPRDLDSAYRLTFSGGWTHNAYGANTSPGVSSAHANTYLKPIDMDQNSVHLSAYVDYSVPNLAGRSGIDIGLENGINVFYLSCMYGYGPSWGAIANLNHSGFVGGYPQNDGMGLTLASRLSSNGSSVYKNGVLLGDRTDISATPMDSYINIGRLGDSEYAYYRKYGLISIGFGLTSSEQYTFYDAVQKFQTSLGRNV